MAAVGSVSLAAEAGSHVGVPDSYACCLARPCDCFPTTQDRETIRTHPPSRQAPKMHQLGLVAASLHFVEERSELLVTHIRQGFARSGLLVV